MLTESIQNDLRRAMHPTFSDGVGYRTATSGTDASDDVEFQIGDGETAIYVGVGPIGTRGNEGYLYVYVPDLATHRDSYKPPDTLAEVSSDCMTLEAELETLVQTVFETDETISLSRDRRHDGVGAYFVCGIPPQTTIVTAENE